MAKGNYKVPFDKSGDMMSYVDQWDINSGNATMKDNYVFEEMLKYTGYGRGRSSATIHFEDSKGKNYSMFLSDFDELMKSGKMSGNQAKSKWTFIKKGKNYGVKIAE